MLSASLAGWVGVGPVMTHSSSAFERPGWQVSVLAAVTKCFLSSVNFHLDKRLSKKKILLLSWRRLPEVYSAKHLNYEEEEEEEAGESEREREREERGPATQKEAAFVPEGNCITYWSMFPASNGHGGWNRWWQLGNSYESNKESLRHKSQVSHLRTSRPPSHSLLLVQRRIPEEFHRLRRAFVSITAPYTGK